MIDTERDKLKRPHKGMIQSTLVVSKNDKIDKVKDGHKRVYSETMPKKCNATLNQLAINTDRYGGSQSEKSGIKRSLGKSS